MFIASAIALTARVASAASATFCNPDFGGRAISIVTKSGSMEWGWGSGQNSGGLEYRAICDGVAEFDVVPALDVPASTPSYRFRTARSTNVLSVVQGPRSHPPVLAWSLSEGTLFTVTCSSCSSVFASSFSGGTFASDCTISWLDSDICVRVQTEGIGDYIRQYPCEGVDDEKFNFVV